MKSLKNGKILKGNFEHAQWDNNLAEMKTTNENGKRLYLTPDGSKYPSATTVLSILTKKAIKAWRKRVGEKKANEISTKASNRGTKVHKLCEDYLNNVEIPVDEEMPINMQMFLSIKPLIDENINQIYMQEAPLYSDHLRMAGRVDCVAHYAGSEHPAIIDFKTSSRPKKKSQIGNYFLQCAAYSIMFEERTGIAVPNLVVMIAVDGDAPQVFVENRNDWTDLLLETRDRYEAEYNPLQIQ